ncbi:hypothetical protein KL86SPO_40210 [uncultured Sporomusa sp.]|uniref:Uncharacterized protein n=1 Tax=uncultured Sporomusa sp. TaxID=307249 RepID=A0A212LW37_9FIRM|nr:hypothetical protein KL86SPO_40210 [uncultured Sporomusa sp.]
MGMVGKSEYRAQRKGVVATGAGCMPVCVTLKRRVNPSNNIVFREMTL